MKNLLKILTLTLVAISLQSCADLLGPPQYAATGKTADLLIDFPEQYTKGYSIYVIQPKKNFLDAGLVELSSSTDNITSPNKPLRISANKALKLDIGYNANISQVCSMRIQFTPLTGRHYRLSTSVSYDYKSGFLKTLLVGNDDKCFIGVQEIKNGALIPVPISFVKD